MQMIFTTHRETCPLITLNSLRILQPKNGKYLGLQTELKKTYIYQTKTTWTSTEENVLTTRYLITTVD